MKLIIQNNRIAATATDEYTGPDEYIDAPADFDITRMGDYVYVNGAISIPSPQVVTMRQARLALLGAGLLDDIDAAINSLPSPQKEAARIEWEYSQEVQRSSGLVSMMGAALGLDDAALDALFIEAVKL
jgi:hypothetical protein